MTAECDCAVWLPAPALRSGEEEGPRWGEPRSLPTFHFSASSILGTSGLRGSPLRVSSGPGAVAQPNNSLLIEQIYDIKLSIVLGEERKLRFLKYLPCAQDSASCFD